MMKMKWDQFYKKPYHERLEMIASDRDLSDEERQRLFADNSDVSNNLIENFLTDYPLPEGVVTNLKVNGRSHLVPMVVEEPSVIAAASNGSKLLAAGDGIHAVVSDRLVGGQIIVKGAEVDQLKRFVNDNEATIFKIANDSHPRVLLYGRGAQKLGVRKLDETFASVDLAVDTGEAMGANMINTMLETVAAWLQQKLGVVITMAILSNYADQSIVAVSGIVPFDKLKNQFLSGEVVAQRIADASHVAQIDIYRAATHNKGIMNGIDASAIAFGNDWRAIESAAQSFASRDGQYRGLSQWQVTPAGLRGKMTVPIPIGYVGGATKVLPLAKINQKIAGVYNVTEEMQIIAAVGLAQNLAALKALVTDGIQKGHMNLQLKSLAMANGATSEEVAAVVTALRKLDHPSSQAVKQILEQLRR